jgi:hypothetical protein
MTKSHQKLSLNLLQGFRPLVHPSLVDVHPFLGTIHKMDHPPARLRLSLPARLPEQPIPLRHPAHRQCQ